MSLVSIGPGVQPAIARQLDRFTPVVYIKKTWSDKWAQAQDLEPVDATEASLPSRSRATFRYRYGRVAKHGQSTITRMVADRPANQFGEPPTDWFVCVVVYPEGRFEPYTLWCGVLPVSQFDVHGTKTIAGVEYPAGDQIYHAYGFDYLLDRRQVIGGHVRKNNTTVWQIGWAPPFNERLERGFSFVGNKSLKRHAANPEDAEQLLPVFVSLGKVTTEEDGEQEDVGAVWSYRDIIEYLLFFSDNYTDPDVATPHFRLAGSDDLLTFLGGVSEQINYTGRSVWAMLDHLIDRRRGLGAKFAYDIDDSDEVGLPRKNSAVELRLFSLVDEPVGVGERTLPKNDDIQEITLDRAIEAEQVTVEFDTLSTYDTIVVQGARTVSCFSVDASTGKLVKAWTDADEAAYEAADDSDREQERFARVFRCFKLPDDFNWTAGLTEPFDNVNPDTNEDGQLLTDANGTYWNRQHRYLPYLPITDPSDVSIETPEGRFMRPLVLFQKFAENEPTGVWVFGDHPPIDDGLPAVDLLVHDRDRLIEVRVKGASQTELAKNHLTAPGDEPFDWEKMVLTIAVETDLRPTVVVKTMAGILPAPVDRLRTLVLTIEDAQVWVVSPQTVVGITAAGTLRRYSGNLIPRDDTPRLREVAALATAWYRRKRSAMTLVARGLYDAYQVGVMLSAAVVLDNLQQIHSPVTERSWSFEQQTSTVRAGYAELDVQAHA